MIVLWVGTVEARYWVYDGWGLGVAGTLRITVEAGCTVTGTVGVAEIVGTDGDDVICVHAPKDRSAFRIFDAEAGDDVIVGGEGVERIRAGARVDVVYGAGRVGTAGCTIIGTPGDDVLVAVAGKNILYRGDGDDGDDTLHGDAGDDRLWGNTSADALDGGDSDYLHGGADVDTCTGGETVARCEQ